MVDAASPPHVKSHMLGTPLISAASVSMRYPIVLIPRHKNNYFKPHESFNLLGMLQNPMVMIMVLTGLMMVGMPYIMVTLLVPSQRTTLTHRVRNTWTRKHWKSLKPIRERLQVSKTLYKVGTSSPGMSAL